MALSFAGISSGIPTDQLIQSILTQEKAPLERLQARQTANNQKKNILQSIKTALTGLATSISSLNSSSLSARTVTSSDASSVSATAKGAASGSYDITVSQLATKARMEITDPSNKFTSPDALIGNNDGDIYTIGKGDKATSITLKDGMTLAELNEAINAESANSGVSSTIVQKKPGEYSLVLSSTETGEGNISLEAKDKTGNLINTPFTATATAGQNAKFTLNGVEMSRTSNTITDAVDGVTLTLNKADSGKTINLNVALDKDSVVKAYQDVVDKFNAAYKAYKNATGKGGAFSGDTSLQSMFSQLRTSMTGVIEDGGRVVGSSAILGMKTERDGTLSLDTKKLEEALKENPDMVGKVFDKASSASKDFIDRLTSSYGGTLTSVINGIDSTNTSLNKQIDVLQARLDRRKEVLTAQFGRMESLIGQLQSAGQSLGGLR